MYYFQIFLCFLVLAAAMPNEGQDSNHEEGKQPKTSDSEMPKAHELPKVSPAKPLENKPQPAMVGHNEHKNWKKWEECYVKSIGYIHKHMYRI